MRVVLDTVIFVRALINPSGRWGRLLFERSTDYVFVVSPEIAGEILEVINRPRLRKRFSGLSELPSLERILAKLEEAEVVEPRGKLRVCRDSKDDKFFECAVEGRANYIVSEDRDILDIGVYEGIRTISAEEFLRLLPAT